MRHGGPWALDSSEHPKVDMQEPLHAEIFRNIYSLKNETWVSASTDTGG